MSTAQSSSWTSFLKSISSFNGDLSSLTAPPFILLPTSLSEYSQYWAEHPDLLVAANQLRPTEDAENYEEDAYALKRAIAVTKWFISTLRSQYCSRSESMGTEKKPLNPFLGEVFVGKWEDQLPEKLVGETELLSEQVSHHPPVTAYAIINKKNNVLLQGYNGIKSSISTTTISVKQYGHALLEYRDLRELYLVTLPPLHIEGLMVASPFVELGGTSYIQASSGYFVAIEFSGRGYFSGKKNTFKARIFRDQASSATKEKALATIAGQWLGKSYIAKGASSPGKSDELFYDAQAKKPEQLVVKPIEQQHPLELRRAWHKVAEAIRKADYDLIHVEKSTLENEQRELRRQEAESNSPWETRWFDHVDYTEQQQDQFLSLATQASLSTREAPSGTLKGSKHDEGSARHWRVNLAKWESELDISI